MYQSSSPVYHYGQQLIITGGVDYTIKIWMFSEALLLHSLNTYNAGWITRVLLHRPEKGSKQFSVICIDYSYIYVWNIDGQQKVCLSNVNKHFAPDFAHFRIRRFW